MPEIILLEFGLSDLNRKDTRRVAEKNKGNKIILCKAC